MGLVVNSISSTDLFFSDALYKAAFVIALLRWAFYWALRLRRRLMPDEDSDLLDSELDYELVQSSSNSSSHTTSSQLIRDSLIRTTFEEVTRRQGNSCRHWDTCAVCLSQLEMGDEVRELRNCCHMFHTECIDRWLDYNGHDHHDGGAGGQEDNHKTCPLCRTPLLTSSQIQSLSWEQSSQPSWAVERLLYLFGEDLVL
ncbi:hypothetical protein ACLB2K_008606 [Fragaria x ananassa]